MRIDKYMKEVGIIKRRSVAKELLECNHIHLTEHDISKTLKASYNVKKGDIISIRKGAVSIVFEVLDIPVRNLKKEDREKYYRMISRDRAADCLDTD